MPAGRPSKYKPGFVERAKALAEQGATDREIAQSIGVAESTLYEWRREFPEFSEALKIGKDRADDRVEMALYRRATGYSFDAEKIFQNSGEIVRTPYVEHVAPDTTAAIFWLKNRRRETWRDVSRTEQTGLDGGPIETHERVEYHVVDPKNPDP